MKENIRFVCRILVIHVVTYLLCGIVFSALFHYDKLYQQENIKFFMRAVGGSSSVLGPLFQAMRGLLFGLILLLLKDSILPQKYGWLKLWIIIAGIGIINAPGPAPCSIEGLIYTRLPLEFHLKGAPEILIQTLLFSYFAAAPSKMKLRGFAKYKIPLISAVLAGVMFSVSGMILAFLLHLDMTAGMTDSGAFFVMFAAMAAVFLMSKWYQDTSFHLKHVIFPLCCYGVLAVMPTLYNYVSGSVFASRLTLGINVIPVVLLFLMNYMAAAFPLSPDM